MTLNPAAIEDIVVTLLKIAPEVLDIVERVARNERARRVEAVRPEAGHGHAETAAEELRTGKAGE